MTVDAWLAIPPHVVAAGLCGVLVAECAMIRAATRRPSHHDEETTDR